MNQPLSSPLLKLIEKEINKAQKTLEEIDNFYKRDLHWLDKLSDAIADIGGSWAFITVFVFILMIWMAINTFLLIKPYDPFPFILLNLFLSMTAALQAPIILMSQKRAAKRDQSKMQIDLEKDIRDLHIDQHSHKMLLQIRKDIEELKRKNTHQYRKRR